MAYDFNHKKTDSFEDYLRRHLEWGHAMFGTPADGRGPLGPLDHLKKEVKEITDDPYDLEEWIDAIILSIDGFLRAGGKLTMVLPMLFKKQGKNAGRDWPDWKTADPDKAIEHVRTADEIAAKVQKTDAEALADIKKVKIDKRRQKRNLKGGSADDR